MPITGLASSKLFAMSEPRQTEAVEDYAKTIYALEHEVAPGAVTTTAVAKRMGVSAPSATAMLKRMDSMGLVEREPYRGVHLTSEGRATALEVIRHHRLLETYLSEVLGMPGELVHDEADRLEHHISEELEDLIAGRLGDPEVDPHGSPIPSSELRIPRRQR